MQAIDFITGKEMLALGCETALSRLKNELVKKDWFMTFPDFCDYRKTRDKVYADYMDESSWQRKMLKNIANAGYFSSDRTIEQYNRDIWKL